MSKEYNLMRLGTLTLSQKEIGLLIRDVPKSKVRLSIWEEGVVHKFNMISIEEWNHHQLHIFKQCCLSRSSFKSRDLTNKHKQLRQELSNNWQSSDVINYITQNSSMTIALRDHQIKRLLGQT